MPAVIPVDFDALMEAAFRDVATLSNRLRVLRQGGAQSSAGSIELAARAMYRQRRGRDRYFDSRLFGEPGWDLLLDLYIARCEGKTRSTKSACIGSAVAPTTALRWLTKLEEARLIRRWHADHDERVTMVALTEAGFEGMSAFLRRATGIDGAPTPSRH